MLVGRFSKEGFLPQVQSYMKSQVDYLKSFDPLTSGLEGYLLETVSKGVNAQLNTLNERFSFVGIHVFFLPVKKINTDLFLNHLKERVPYHERWFDNDTPCYPLDIPFCSNISTLDTLFKQRRVGAYIPEEFLQ